MPRDSYRLSVGLMIVNNDKKVFVGQRLFHSSIIPKNEEGAWQMPQGGIDHGETPPQAALRELMEEVGCDNVEIISEAKEWYSYDLPEYSKDKSWGRRFKGQRQKWFLLQFLGKDEDINVNTKKPEFTNWRWVDYSELTGLIVPFKREVYEDVVKEFEWFFTKS